MVIYHKKKWTSELENNSDFYLHLTKLFTSISAKVLKNIYLCLFNSVTTVTFHFDKSNFNSDTLFTNCNKAINKAFMLKNKRMTRNKITSAEYFINKYIHGYINTQIQILDI